MSEELTLTVYRRKYHLWVSDAVVNDMGAHDIEALVKQRVTHLLAASLFSPHSWRFTWTAPKHVDEVLTLAELEAGTYPRGAWHLGVTLQALEL